MDDEVWTTVQRDVRMQPLVELPVVERMHALRDSDRPPAGRTEMLLALGAISQLAGRGWASMPERTYEQLCFATVAASGWRTEAGSDPGERA